MNNNFTKKELFASVFGGLILLLIMVSIVKSNPVQIGDSGYPNKFPVATTGNKSVLATSTIILSNNPTRVYAVICNDSSNVVYLSYNSLTGYGANNVATSNTGYRLAAAACFEVKDYIGAVAGVSSATSTVTYLEK